MHKRVIHVVGHVAAFALTAAAANKYPKMAPVDQYLMANQDAEIALAKTAAPSSISGNAEIMILERKGFRTAVKGTNGFVCVVFRAWTGGINDEEFWNPKNRSPICFNPPAVRSYLPLILARTKALLTGKSKADAFREVTAALDRKELPAIEAGAMCYMLSKDQYLNDEAGHWHPHLMFFVPRTEAKVWGADVAGSPVLSTDDPEDRLTVFMIPVAKWSDGSADAHQK